MQKEIYDIHIHIHSGDDDGVLFDENKHPKKKNKAQIKRTAKDWFLSFAMFKYYRTDEARFPLLATYRKSSISFSAIFYSICWIFFSGEIKIK